jgi:putative SOS response-associated peptidase YedK
VCHLQADLGRNRRVLSADAPPTGGEHPARFNVCPTTTIDTILDQDGKRRLERMRWGLIPSWWSKPPKDMKLATFNARVEIE